MRQAWQPHFAAQPAVADAFLSMHEQALCDGIDLLPCASFRPFGAQLRNWNRKFAGEVALHNRDRRLRDHGMLTLPELLHAILGWTALPGASRCHWGTDIAVYDRAAIPPDYRLKLLHEEAAPGGVVAHLHAWLDTHMDAVGFFRPFRSDRGGIYPAP